MPQSSPPGPQDAWSPRYVQVTENETSTQVKIQFRPAQGSQPEKLTHSRKLPASTNRKYLTWHKKKFYPFLWLAWARRTIPWAQLGRENVSSGTEIRKGNIRKCSVRSRAPRIASPESESQPEPGIGVLVRAPLPLYTRHKVTENIRGMIVWATNQKTQKTKQVKSGSNDKHEQRREKVENKDPYHVSWRKNNGTPLCGNFMVNRFGVFGRLT